MLRRRILTAIVAVCLPITALAQVNATVVGSVSDASGAFIPGAEITATNVNTGIAATQVSNETGVYVFASLQPGTYRVSAVLPGFQTQTYQNVVLSQGQQVRLNFTLEVAVVGQTVEVSVNADTLLATTSASIGDALPDVEVRNLPLAVRDVLALIRTTAGAVGSNFGGQSGGALNTTRDGLVVMDTRYMATVGAQGGTFVSPDLVEEVQIVVGSVDAEAGRGSGQVSLQTRSGTNDFHGALFYSNNNSALNAKNWFANLRGEQKPYLNRNQYGGRLGGPVIRNKAFFFVLIDNQRYIQKQNFIAPVLTDQARQGIFRYTSGRTNGNALSATPSVDRNGNILDPANVRSFHLFNDVNDPFRRAISTNPYWRTVLGQMPQPNDWTTGDGLNVAGYRWSRALDGLGGGNAAGNNNNRDQLNLRFDYQVNRTNRLSFTHSREDNWGVTENLLSTWPGGFAGSNQYFPNLWTAAWTSTLSATALNDFRVGRKVTSYHRRAPFQLGCCFGNTHDDRNEEAQEAFDLLPKSGGYPLYPIPSIFPGNIMQHGFDTTRGQKSPLLQISDNISWNRGSHSFKTGFEIVKNWSDGWNTTAEQIPTAIFGNGTAPVQGISSARFPGLQAADATRAEQVLNDLAGSIGELTQGYLVNSPTQTEWFDFNSEFRRFRKLTQQDWSLFFKDTWNVTSNLTLNLGMRYDKYGVMYDQTGMLANGKGGQSSAFGLSGKDFSALWNPFATGGSLTEVQLVGKHSPNANTSFWRNDWNDLGPFVGFSYHIPWLGRPTVIRGGYGVNYSGASTLFDYELSFSNSPGSVTIERPVPSTYLDLATAVSTNVLPLKPSIAAGGIATIPLTSRTQVFHATADDWATPYIQSFNLSVQHELMRGLSLDVSYIGNKGTKLYSNIELNEPNIIENGILDAFNVTRAGGNAPLFDQILNGLNVPGAGVVNGTTLTGSQALRIFGTTDNWFADGEVGRLAGWLNNTTALTGVAGGLLRRAGLTENFIMVNPQFGNVQLWGTRGNSTCHSMQLQLRKQLSRGFSGQFSYTWAKALGDSVNGDTVRDAVDTIDPRNRSLNKGRLSFDRTHAFRAHGTWELPFGSGRRLLGNVPNWLNRIAGGWQISSILTQVSGAPLMITSPNRTVTSNYIGAANISLPDIVGNFPKSLGKVKVGDGFVEYFSGISTRPSPRPNFGTDPNNLAADLANLDVVDASGNVLLRNPEPGKAGTLGTRWIQGPTRFGLDLSLAKRTQISERLSFTIRADLVDALNMPQWGNPSAANLSINSNSFGRITTAEGERTVTVGARIDF
jgi:hypothetical protein